MIAGAVGVGLDYAAAAQTRGKMQAVTDAAALNAAREFQMVQANVEKVSTVARNYASQIQGATVDVAVDITALTIRVTMDKDVQNLFGKLGWGATTHVRTSATAKMTNGLPLCLLALEPKAKDAIRLEKNARLTAPACVVNSNSTSPNGLASHG